MKKSAELPLVKPLYGTYHYQGAGGATITSNPSVENWFLSNALVLNCARSFLFGYSSPKISVENSSWLDNPNFEQRWYDTEYLNGYINFVIKNLIDDGFYVVFGGVDDFFVEGKTWYKKRHFNHDGLICGYDRDEKTYSLYAYDENWLYRRFKTPQKGFNDGRQAMFQRGYYEAFCGIRPKKDPVLFEPEKAVEKIREHLNFSFDDVPADEDGIVKGNIVHDYIAMYLDKLIQNEFSYEKTDRRVFRMIYEHKAALQKSIRKIEKAADLDNETSGSFDKIVRKTDEMRLLYASYCMKKRESALPLLKKRLLTLKEEEGKTLSEFLKKWERG